MDKIKKNFGFGCMRLPMKDGEVDIPETKKMVDAFLDAGFDVTNLGVLVPQDEFIKAAVEVGADAICVSSLYGQGEIDCTGMREKCDEAGLKGILLYAGGNLVVGKVPVEEIERRYKAMGFDRAFGPGTDPQVTIACLKKDLGIE